jgi:AraC-like DNA-binding protein
MPESGADIFNDPDDYRTSLGDAGIELGLVCTGKFQARLTRVALCQLHLLQGCESIARIAHLRLTPRFAFVTFPIDGDSLMTWAGMPLRRDEILFHGRGEHLHQRTIGACRWGAIFLKPDHLLANGRALVEQDLVPPPAGRVVRSSPSAASRLRHLHNTACRLAETKPGVIAHPEVARALDQDLIHALVNCLAEGEAVADSRTRRRHARIMAQFEELLASQGAAQMPMPELCRIMEVSERALRICCAEFLGMSPDRYRRLRRMHAAHSALRHADSKTGVAEIARRYGFSELGRFATAYRALFGERPSNTLRHHLGRIMT